MINVIGCKKSYGNNEVLKGITFQVEEGDFIAIIGKNGSGKSTLVDIMTKMKTADEGNVEYGFDEKKIYDYMGIQFQNADFDIRMKVKTLFGLWKEIYNVNQSRYEELIELLDLQYILNRKIGNISGGEKQKMNIFLALINNPKVLILDELTTGLDAITRLEIRKYLKKINVENKKTIIMVSHYMDEVQELCNKAFFIKNGVIVESGMVSELMKKHTVDSMDDVLAEVMV